MQHPLNLFDNLFVSQHNVLHEGAEKVWYDVTISILYTMAKLRIHGITKFV